MQTSLPPHAAVTMMTQLSSARLIAHCRVCALQFVAALFGCYPSDAREALKAYKQSV